MVKKGEVKFDPADWSDVSSHAIDFIKLMLTYDPKTRRGPPPEPQATRPTAAELLTHQWLTASASAPVGRVAKDLGHKLSLDGVSTQKATQIVGRTHFEAPGGEENERG